MFFITSREGRYRWPSLFAGLLFPQKSDFFMREHLAITFDDYLWSQSPEVWRTLRRSPPCSCRGRGTRGWPTCRDRSEATCCNQGTEFPAMIKKQRVMRRFSLKVKSICTFVIFCEGFKIQTLKFCLYYKARFCKWVRYSKNDVHFNCSQNWAKKVNRCMGHNLHL